VSKILLSHLQKRKTRWPSLPRSPKGGRGLSSLLRVSGKKKSTSNSRRERRGKSEELDAPTLLRHRRAGWREHLSIMGKRGGRTRVRRECASKERKRVVVCAVKKKKKKPTLPLPAEREEKKKKEGV